MSYYNSESVAINVDFQLNMVNAFGTRPSGPLLPSATVHLYKQQDVLATPSTPLVDLQSWECDFSGYSPANLVMTAPVHLAPDTLGGAGSVTFACEFADPQVTNTAHGYWVQQGSDVVVQESFPDQNGYGFSSPGDFLTINVGIPVPGYADTQ